MGSSDKERGVARGSAEWIAAAIMRAVNAPVQTDDRSALIVTIPRELAILAAARLEGIDTTHPEDGRVHLKDQS